MKGGSASRPKAFSVGYEEGKAFRRNYLMPKNDFKEIIEAEDLLSVDTDSDGGFGGWLGELGKSRYKGSTIT